jgi:hypothetical protein
MTASFPPPHIAAFRRRRSLVRKRRFAGLNGVRTVRFFNKPAAKLNEKQSKLRFGPTFASPLALPEA